MEAATAPTPGRISPPSPTRWAWRGGIVLLFAWQLWLTLGLFGPPPYRDLFNDQPVLSGSHGQHLYLGALGAEARTKRGRTVVYDHAFQAGYPKTPIFDGSRFAELCLLVAGGEYRPVAYKIGIVLFCMLVPLMLLIACVSISLDGSATFWAMLLGQFVWWGPLGRNALEAGESELFIAALSGLAHIGLLVRFHRSSSGCCENSTVTPGWPTPVANVMRSISSVAAIAWSP